MSQPLSRRCSRFALATKSRAWPSSSSTACSAYTKAPCNSVGRIRSRTCLATSSACIRRASRDACYESRTFSSSARSRNSTSSTPTEQSATSKASFPTPSVPSSSSPASSSASSTAATSASSSYGLRPFSFHVGVSFIGKPVWDDEDRPQTDPFPDEHVVSTFRERMLSWQKQVPSIDAGQDFFFVEDMMNKSVPEAPRRARTMDSSLRYGHVKGVSVGIADGVGGWGDTLDPSLFSQALMYHASQVAKESWPGEPESDPTEQDRGLTRVQGRQLDPVRCMDVAHGAVLKEKAVPGGSSTACIMSFDCNTGRMRAANLGDSGFYVIRGDRMIYAQPPQTHFFNCPWQLSKYPDGHMTHGALMDTAQSAARFNLRLRHGDIIIAYTDGLSDNVFPNETLKYTLNIMRRRESERERAQFLADFLVIHGRRCMFDAGRVSPFEVEWAEHNKQSRPYHGGVRFCSLRKS